MIKIAQKLTNFILDKKLIQADDYEVYQYGFQSFLEISINILCSIIIAVILDMKLECIIFFLIFIPLRSYNGGFHLDKYYACLFFSCISLGSILFIVKYLTPPLYVSLILYLLSLLLILSIGPVDHPNRKVDESENTHFIKKTRLALLLSLVVAFIFLLTDQRRFLFLESLVFVLVSSTVVLGKMRYSREY